MLAPHQSQVLVPTPCRSQVSVLVPCLSLLPVLVSPDLEPLEGNEADLSHILQPATSEETRAGLSLQEMAVVAVVWLPVTAAALQPALLGSNSVSFKSRVFRVAS